MNEIWIRRAGNNQCILFFNGWGMDERAVSHFHTDDFDVLMLNDYSILDRISEPLQHYHSVYVVAWSLGVWASAKVLSSVSIDKAIAMNGTLDPIHHRMGIPPEIFQATLDSWSQETRFRFNCRMAGGRKLLEGITNRMSLRETDNQKSELHSIQQQVIKSGKVEMNFDRVLIGTGDLIFPPDNQRQSWSASTRKLEVNCPHYPFAMFERWKQIIEL